MHVFGVREEARAPRDPCRFKPFSRAQPRVGRSQVRWSHDLISAFCRWCWSVGFIDPLPPDCTGQFAAKCDASGVKSSISKSEDMILSRNRVECPLLVALWVSTPSRWISYLSILGSCSWMKEEWNKRLTDELAQSSVMKKPFQSVVLKRELSMKTKPSVYQLIYSHPQRWSGYLGGEWEWKQMVEKRFFCKV